MGVRCRKERIPVGTCGSWLCSQAIHCPSPSLQCQQGFRGTCARRKTRLLAAAFPRALNEQCHKLVSCSVWHGQGLSKSLSSVKRHYIARWQLEPLLPSTTAYVFSNHFHRSPRLCLSYMSLTDRKHSISSSLVKNFSLLSAELVMPPSTPLVLTSNSIDFCIHKPDLMGIPVGTQCTLHPYFKYDHLSLPLMPL